MSALALLLVLTAALVHATWNYFLKKANTTRPFWWLVYIITAIITVPRAIAKLEGSHRKLFCNFAVFAKPDAPLNDRPFAHLPTPIFAPVRPSTRKSSPANRGRFPESLLSRDSAEFLIWVSSADVLPDQFS